MPMSESYPLYRKMSLIVVFLATLTFLSLAQFVTIVEAQDSWPLENPFSPLVSFPMLRGEAKFALFWPTIQNGNFEDNDKKKRPLKSFYNMRADSPFIDFMMRFQLGRFSSRTYYEWREFTAGHRAANDSAIDFSGVRQGFDVDMFLGNKSRVGLNVDGNFFQPKFSVRRDDNTNTTIRVSGIKESWTIGLHAIYNPTWNIFGMSAITEFWARWPIGGTSVTDYQLSGGLKWPETILGSFSVQAGYRWTSINFSDKKGNVDASWDGVFGQIAYYYH